MPGSDQLPFDDDAAPAVASSELGAAISPGAAEARPVGERGAPTAGSAPATRPAPGAEVPSAPERPAASASFQAAAGIQGRQFAEQCDTLLASMGFTLRGRRVLVEVGIEVDQEAVSPAGSTVWFEYKGSVQGNRPGLRRTDTLKKAIANGALLRALPDPAPYVVVTSHLPEAGSGAAMLEAALRLGYVADVVCLYDPKATQRLRRW
jgi:hypothetical protein